MLIDNKGITVAGTLCWHGKLTTVSHSVIQKWPHWFNAGLVGRFSPHWAMPSTFGSLQNNHGKSFGLKKKGVAFLHSVYKYSQNVPDLVQNTSQKLWYNYSSSVCSNAMYRSIARAVSSCQINHGRLDHDHSGQYLCFHRLHPGMFPQRLRSSSVVFEQVTEVECSRVNQQRAEWARQEVRQQNSMVHPFNFFQSFNLQHRKVRTISNKNT